MNHFQKQKYTKIYQYILTYILERERLERERLERERKEREERERLERERLERERLERERLERERQEREARRRAIFWLFQVCMSIYIDIFWYIFVFGNGSSVFDLG